MAKTLARVGAHIVLAGKGAQAGKVSRLVRAGAGDAGHVLSVELGLRGQMRVTKAAQVVALRVAGALVEPRLGLVSPGARQRVHVGAPVAV